MSLLLILFAVGIVLLALEIVTPGPLCGIVGTVCMVLGVIRAFALFGALGGGAAVLLALAALAAVIYLEFIWLPRSRVVKLVAVDGVNEGTSQPALARPEAVVGREGVAQTVLAPSGFVLVDGCRYEASSRSGHVEAGERLRVVGLDNFRLLVTKV